MSADNWAVCPRCFRRAKQKAAEQLAEVIGSYGKVPVEVFDRDRSMIGPVSEQDFRTFREDYEIYGAADGVVKVGYAGHCDVCGLGLDFNDEHPIGGIDG